MARSNREAISATVPPHRPGKTMYGLRAVTNWKQRELFKFEAESIEEIQDYIKGEGQWTMHKCGLFWDPSRNRYWTRESFSWLEPYER